MDIDKLIKSARAKFPEDPELLKAAATVYKEADGEERKMASVSWKIKYVPLEELPPEETLSDSSGAFDVRTEYWEEDGWNCSSSLIRMYSFTQEDKKLLSDLGILKTVERKSYETQLVCDRWEDDQC